jgi:hypothetical protein
MSMDARVRDGSVKSFLSDTAFHAKEQSPDKILCVQPYRRDTPKKLPTEFGQIIVMFALEYELAL